jgi:hypothetical protein
MIPKNIKQFKALIERYETITLDEIKQEKMNKAKLTGFDSPDTCTLCLAVKQECYNCVYGTFCGCCGGENRSTYYGITDAKTVKQLLNAFRARAKHMRKTYPQYL